MVELVWDGKYDKDGNRVAPLRVALPFQTVETVNESAQQRQRMLDLFAAGRDAEWRNRLIWGDKKYVLPSLLPEFAGKVDLIYIDPPFATGANFAFTAQVGETDFIKQPNIIETKAYRDTWQKGIESYIPWLYEGLLQLTELLAPTGLMFVHVGQNLSHYVRAILDELFGTDNFKNQVIWKRTFSHGNFGQGAKHLGPLHDVIFIYSRSDSHKWNHIFTEYDKDYIDKFYKNVDPGTGRRYQLITCTAPGGAKKGNPYYEFLGIKRYWSFSKENMQKLYEAGEIVQTKPGAVPRRKRYLDDMKGRPLQDLWMDISPVQGQAIEFTGYNTQKPEKLIRRILEIASLENDLVLDCFCGSGTTAAVAEKLGRRWIACDLGRFAIHTTRKRLLGIENVRPFVVQNLGKYERQVWQKAEFGAEAAYQMRSYRKFILDLYHAEMVEGYTWLHGRKGGRMVHVGSVDSPVAAGDVRQMAIEFQRAIGSGKNAPTSAGVDILGWDFALDTNETAQQTAAEAGLKVRFLRIPREVLEKKAVDQGDIKFFELAALQVDKSLSGRELSVWLTDFMIPPDDVPDDVAKAVRHWEDWIDYWAVDFNYRDDTFHNQRQTYRTRKDRTLLPRLNYTYSEPGDYVVLVKVIDILGNDTTKTLNVKVV